MRLKSSVLGLIVGLVVVSPGSLATAGLKLPAVIGDNMVLQQGRPIYLWGWADKGAEVVVSIAGQTVSTKADDQGRWKVLLAKLESGDPLELSIKSGSETRTAQERAGGRSLGLFGPIEHGNGCGRGQRRGQRDRRGQIPADPPVHRRETQRARSAGRLQGQLPVDRVQPGYPGQRRLGRFLRRGLLFRPRAPQATQRADRPDPHLLGRTPADSGPAARPWKPNPSSRVCTGRAFITG